MVRKAREGHMCAPPCSDFPSGWKRRDLTRLPQFSPMTGVLGFGSHGNDSRGESAPKCVYSVCDSRFEESAHYDLIFVLF